MTDIAHGRASFLSLISTCIATGCGVGDTRQTDLFSIRYQIGHSSDIPFIVFIWDPKGARD